MIKYILKRNPCEMLLKFEIIAMQPIRWVLMVLLRIWWNIIYLRSDS